MVDLFVLQGALNPATAHMAMTALPLVRTSADSSEPILRPLPAMTHNAKILDAYDPDLGYDAENSSDQQNAREKRLICSAWLLAR